MRRKDKSLQAEIAAATASTLTGVAFDTASDIVRRLGAQLYDISGDEDQDRRTIYVWARVADGEVKRVLSVGYPRASCAGRSRGQRTPSALHAPVSPTPPTAHVAHRSSRSPVEAATGCSAGR